MSGEALLQIPGATAYKVAKSTHAVNAIANGDFVIAFASQEDDAGLLAQVGSVSWPLGRWAACLRFDDLTYAFQLPQLPYDDAGGHYYCVTLPPNTSLELRDLLQAVLASGTAYHDQQHIVAAQPQPQPQQQSQPGATAAAASAASASAGDVRSAAAAAVTQAPYAVQELPSGSASRADRVAEGLQRGGQLAAAGVLAAAAWAGAAIQRRAEKAVARMQPAECQRAPLSPEAQARLDRAKSVAAKAAEVSGRAVSGALSVTAHVAGALAQRISATDLGRQMSSGRTAQDLRKVGVAGVDAIEAVYDSLADAARVVLAHTHAATTRVAGHKYGPGAAQATDAGMLVTRSVVETGLNVYKLRPTALVKKAVKGTAKQVVLGPRPGETPGAAAPAGTQAVVPGALVAGGGSVTSSNSGAGAGLAGPSGSGGAPPPPPPVTAAAAAAAVSMLAALTAPPPPPPPPPPAPYGAAVPSPRVPTGGADVVDGVVVSGPVPAYPAAAPVVDYTPSAAVAAAAMGHHPPAPPIPMQPMPLPLPSPPLPYGAGLPAAVYPGAVAPPLPLSPEGSAGLGAGSHGVPISPQGYSVHGGLPYPAVSDSQYAARFYPAVPRA